MTYIKILRITLTKSFCCDRMHRPSGAGFARIHVMALYAKETGMKPFLMMTLAVVVLMAQGGVATAESKTTAKPAYVWVKQAVICPQTGKHLGTKRVRALKSSLRKGG